MSLSCPMWPWPSIDEDDEEDTEPLHRPSIWLAVVLLAGLMLCGCSTAPIPPTDGPLILLWSPATIPMSSATAWAKQAEKRLGTSNIAVIVCHGGTQTVERDGHVVKRWMLFPDKPRKAMPVDDVVWVLRDMNLSRLICVVACNADGFTLTCPGTIYARNTVWTSPNADTPLWPLRRQDWIGRIELFDSTDKVRLAGER